MYIVAIKNFRYYLVCYRKQIFVIYFEFQTILFVFENSSKVLQSRVEDIST